MYCLYELATGRIVASGASTPQEHDPLTHGLFQASRHPNTKAERYDAILEQLRAATPEEIAADDVLRLDEKAQGDFSQAKLTRALALWVAGKLGVTAATMRAEVLTIYKGL